MEHRALQVLDFPLILDMLASKTSMSISRELALTLVPRESASEVITLQQETREAGWALSHLFASSHPMSGIRDIDSVLSRACQGTVLDPSELLDIAYTLSSASRLRGRLSEHENEMPILSGHAASLGSFPELVSEIKRCISQECEVVDAASPSLKRIREKLRVVSARLREKVDSVIRQEDILVFLQEPIVTIRDGRYVLPVKREHRNRVPGIVHDASSSGATVFVEPAGIVEVSNEKRRLEAEEREEVRRILRELTDLVVNDRRRIQETLESLAYLDLSFAKARLASDMGAHEPSITQFPKIRLIKAVHPLLGRDARPIDIRLGDDFDVLMITGPNTGGKTVALKTTGLLCLMTQVGLFIPAAEGSEVGVFTRVFADIGDEQSIEQSLSTFSSHMRNIIEIVKGADSQSLVLLDELGAGTDPAEGAAIAMAVLEYLLDKQAKCIVTTHSGELKLFAYQRPRVENARVEFDPVTLAPTFELSIGLPGRSNALEISRRLGIPEGIWQRAMGLMSEGGLRVEDAISSLEAERKTLSESLSRLENEHEEVSREKNKLQAKISALRRDRARVLEKATRDSRALVRSTKQELNVTLKQVKNLRSDLESSIRELQASNLAGLAQPGKEGFRYHELIKNSSEAVRLIGPEMDRARLKIQDIQARLEEISPSSQCDKAGPWPLSGTAYNDSDWNAEGGPLKVGGRVIQPVRDPGEIKMNDSVIVLGLGREGEVVSEPDPTGNVTVEMEGIRVKSNITGLLKVIESGTEEGNQVPGRGVSEPFPGSKSSSIARHKTATISPQIDLRGLLSEEAVDRLDKYLDDAILCGLDRVKVIHGKGTGSLRKAVRSFLENHHQVKSLRTGDLEEGGDGVTIVQIV